MRNAFFIFPKPKLHPFISGSGALPAGGMLGILDAILPAHVVDLILSVLGNFRETSSMRPRKEVPSSSRI